MHWFSFSNGNLLCQIIALQTYFLNFFILWSYIIICYIMELAKKKKRKMIFTHEKIIIIPSWLKKKALIFSKQKMQHILQLLKFKTDNLKKTNSFSLSFPYPIFYGEFISIIFWTFLINLFFWFMTG